VVNGIPVLLNLDYNSAEKDEILYMAALALYADIKNKYVVKNLLFLPE
jgi:hypothetical protein